MIIYKQVCESLEKTENGKFDERKLGREIVRSWARKKEYVIKNNESLWWFAAQERRSGNMRFDII